MGGWENATHLLTQYGLFPGVFLGIVLFLVFYRSDYGIDVPLFLAGVALGYWGEWWGTTRGVWTYWNGATPPVYLPPLWGIGLITAYRLGTFLIPGIGKISSPWMEKGMVASFLLLPVLAFARSYSLLAMVDWRGRLDFHFVTGIVVAIALILYKFDLRETFVFFLCGTLLGGMYEFLGTYWGEWVYITSEVPPLWIAPLWGFATVAMTKLARLTTLIFQMVVA